MVVVAAVAAAAAAYGLGVRTVGARGGRWPGARTAAFALGAVALAAAGVGPAAGEGPVAHVVGHLLVGMAAPLLLALGAPATLALRVASPGGRRALRRALGTPAAKVAFHPLVSFPLFAGSLFVLYLTPLYEATAANGWLHELVHLHFLAAGVLFLWPLASPDPVPVRLPPAGRVLVAFLTVPAHAVLGVALLGDARTAAERDAASLLWAAGDVVGLGIAGAVLAQWYRRESRPTAVLRNGGAGRVSG